MTKTTPQAFLIFMVIFLAVTLGTPFILAQFLPTIFAMLGSMGISVITGIVLFGLLFYSGKEASPAQ